MYFAIICDIEFTGDISEHATSDYIMFKDANTFEDKEEAIAWTNKVLHIYEEFDGIYAGYVLPIETKTGIVSCRNKE